MQIQNFRRHALCPKPQSPARDELIQPMQHWFNHLAGPLVPAERLALRDIIAGADFLEVEGVVYLLARVEPKTVDALAAFEAEASEVEDDNEDRCPANEDDLSSLPGSGTHEVQEDDEPNGDQELEPVGGAGLKFAKAARDRYQAKGLRRRSMAFAVLSPSGEIIGRERRNFTSMRGK